MKVVISALLVAVGVIVAVLGYMRLHSMAGPARSVPAGFADNAMLLVSFGVGLALVGAALTVFFALRSRS